MNRKKIHDGFILMGAAIVGLVIPLFLLGKALILGAKWEWLMSLSDAAQALLFMAFGLLLVVVSGFLVGKYFDSFYE